ncbi:CCHC-type domain-containing protein [Durusdinium trenchii]|uniref:CCHC-type domain-containing protein n=1 Tax=Durusdinium trenchii TaxID=1381693 RepID=A0ABP0LSA8_9DINO
MAAEVVGAENDEETPKDIVVDWMADWICKMEVIRPELLRAVPVACALRGLRRPTAKAKDLYRSSVQTVRIDEFWSHSWQRKSWKKISSLLFLKRGLPAGVMGTLAALIGAAVSSYGLLPPSVPFGTISLWNTIFGFLGFFLTLFTWPGRERIFLDACCIHQSHARSKAEGIRSMSGILKRSQKMLVLWDKTYAERLWCMFELAAFVKSRGAGGMAKGHLAIRPTLLGPCVLAIVLSLSSFFIILVCVFSYGWDHMELLGGVSLAVLILSYPAAAVFRGYFHSVHVLQEQLQDFRLSNTKCYCCTVKHVTEKGVPLPLCDREILTKSIGIWFGSGLNFEQDARSVVLECLTEQLGHNYFPYWLWLVATSPILWIFLDITVKSQSRPGGAWSDQWPFWFISAWGWWMGAVPCCGAAFFHICKVLRTPWKTRWMDRAMNLLVALVMQPIFGTSFLIIRLLFQWPLPPWLSGSISSVVHIALASLVWNVSAWTRQLGLAS